ncbi:MAG: hypothetical protein OXH04_13400 [Acidobacteria bacterium]|nr:hypothetical protein [Acidobacteriota bacterium]
MQGRTRRGTVPRMAAIGLATGAVVLGASLAAASLAAAGRAAQPADPALYRCADAARVEAERVGLTLCDAAPTPALADRAERDNLQLRPGALVVAVVPEGLAAREGLLPNDMIFRVAGSDVAGGGAASARLVAVGAESDTLVNFLRGGRPYLVKLRRMP